MSSCVEFKNNAVKSISKYKVCVTAPNSKSAPWIGSKILAANMPVETKNSLSKKKNDVHEFSTDKCPVNDQWYMFFF